MEKSKNVVFDTNILIYFFSGNVNAGEAVRYYNTVISSITTIELLSGKNQTPKERELIRGFLEGITPIQTTPLISELAINFRLSYNLIVTDAIIAATAKYLDSPLITSDAAFFKIKEIEIIPFTK
jgi:predicted nucleic acid-binding protein